VACGTTESRTKAGIETDMSVSSFSPDGQPTWTSRYGSTNGGDDMVAGMAGIGSHLSVEDVRLIGRGRPAGASSSSPSHLMQARYGGDGRFIWGRSTDLGGRKLDRIWATSSNAEMRSAVLVGVIGDDGDRGHRLVSLGADGAMEWTRSIGPVAYVFGGMGAPMAKVILTPRGDTVVTITAFGKGDDGPWADFYTTKHDAAGNLVWHDHYGARRIIEFPQAMALDGDSYVCVTARIMPEHVPPTFVVLQYLQ
jgi:hypothetical protein